MYFILSWFISGINFFSLCFLFIIMKMIWKFKLYRFSNIWTISTSPYNLWWKEKIKICYLSLDVLVKKTSTFFITSIYRKPTFTGLYLNWNPFAPKSGRLTLSKPLSSVQWWYAWSVNWMMNLRSPIFSLQMATLNVLFYVRLNLQFLNFK